MKFSVTHSSEQSMIAWESKDFKKVGLLCRGTEPHRKSEKNMRDWPGSFNITLY